MVTFAASEDSYRQSGPAVGHRNSPKRHHYALKMSWFLVMAAIGAYLADGGFRKSEAKPFIYLVKRAQLLWKGNAYRMLGISGVIITVLGIIFHFTRG